MNSGCHCSSLNFPNVYPSMEINIRGAPEQSVYNLLRSCELLLAKQINLQIFNLT